MKRKAALSSLFPGLDDIPSTCRLLSPVHQWQILINGELLPWEGLMQSVCSPIYLREPSDELKPVVIGSYPIGGQDEARLALKAAVDAFDTGKGEGSSMSVNQRVNRIWLLIQHMVRRKENIVRLIVWEIGKTVQDADSEFERTIGYVLETSKALKKLANDSSQFIVQQNFIGQVKKSSPWCGLVHGPPLTTRSMKRSRL